MYKPLADKIRPKSLSEVFGIFYGPPGTGKTTVADIVAKASNKKFYKLNGTSANIDKIKEVIGEIGTLDAQNGILLYIDELHYLNKRQQQSILEYIESGEITLIGSTTENINFSIFKAILSRCITVEFKELTVKDIIKGLKRAINISEKEYKVNIAYEESALKYIGEISGGDLRRALNILELIINGSFPGEGTEILINVERVKECCQSKIINYDRDGDGHYNLLSYLQKCIRGSDPQASIHALARLIKTGDMDSICRRLLVIASEDVGLAYPQAIAIVKACVDSALMLGLPEARIPLAQATLLLATAPKSNSCYKAIGAALHDIDTMDVGQIPPYLCDTHSNNAINVKQKYLYPHDYNNNYVEQQYLPDNLAGRIYYEYGTNKVEQSSKAYWDRIKKSSK